MVIEDTIQDVSFISNSLFFSFLSYSDEEAHNRQIELDLLTGELERANTRVLTLEKAVREGEEKRRKKQMKIKRRVKERESVFLSSRESTFYFFLS